MAKAKLRWFSVAKKKKKNPYLKNIFNCKIHSLNKGKKTQKALSFNEIPLKIKNDDSSLNLLRLNFYSIFMTPIFVVVVTIFYGFNCHMHLLIIGMKETTN